MEVVLHFCVDDGIKSRCHRELLFGERPRFFSCYTAPHKLYGTMTVCNFAEFFKPWPEVNLKAEEHAAALAEWLKTPMEFDEPPTAKHFKIIREAAKLVGSEGYRYQLRHYYLQDGGIEELEKEETQELDEERLAEQEMEPSMTSAQRLEAEEQRELEEALAKQEEERLAREAEEQARKKQAAREAAAKSRKEKEIQERLKN